MQNNCSMSRSGPKVVRFRKSKLVLTKHYFARFALMCTTDPRSQVTKYSSRDQSLFNLIYTDHLLSLTVSPGPNPRKVSLSWGCPSNGLE